MEDDRVKKTKEAQDFTLNNFESRIHESYYYLSKTHRKIANYILNNRNTVLDNSITVLAKKIGTTPATITRFCQVLRYRGFNELKFYMENDLIAPADESGLVKLEEPLLVSIHKLLKYNIDALNDTLLLLNEAKLAEAIKLIVEADKVYFYAEGATGSAAHYGYRLLLQNGVSSNCFTDAALMLISASHLTKRDVVIGISYSGEAENVLTAMRFARKNKASAIAITAFPKSRFAKAANVCLSYSCNIHDDLRYLHTACICEIAILGILQTGLINHMMKTNDKRLNDLKYAITSKRLNQTNPIH